MPNACSKYYFCSNTPHQLSIAYIIAASHLNHIGCVKFSFSMISWAYSCSTVMIRLYVTISQYQLLKINLYQLNYIHSVYWMVFFLWEFRPSLYQVLTCFRSWDKWKYIYYYFLAMKFRPNVNGTHLLTVILFVVKSYQNLPSSMGHA
jgi:hypothetical protein